MNKNSNGTYTELFIIQALLIIAKIVGAISWKWSWVFIPSLTLIFIVVASILLFTIAYTIKIIVLLTGKCCLLLSGCKTIARLRQIANSITKSLHTWRFRK